MSRSQKIIIGVLVALILVTFAGIFVALISIYRQNRAAQIAALPEPTPFPTVVYPATYTAVPTVPSPTFSAVGGAPQNGAALNKTPRPRATIDPNNPIAVAMSEAIKKSQAAKQGRFQMQFSMEGDLGSEIPAAYSQDGKVTLLALDGQVKDKDSHISFKGILATMLGANPDVGIEFMSVGGKTYLRGPLVFLGITDDKWYVATGANSFTPENTSPDQILSEFDGNLNWSGITLVGTEQLDGQNCRVYLADKMTTLGGIQTMSDATNQLPSNFDLNNIRTAETKFWICDDGYFHQMTLNIQAQNKQDATKTVGLAIIVHMYDFDGNFEIHAPANAIPWDMSKFLSVTPTKPAQ